MTEPLLTAEETHRWPLMTATWWVTPQPSFSRFQVIVRAGPPAGRAPR
jgi:hypothetical protein